MWAVLGMDRGYASMGPPREHGGVIAAGDEIALVVAQLQWGRRANTAECAETVISVLESMIGFNGAAARTRRSASSCRRCMTPTEALQWGRRANTAECAS